MKVRVRADMKGVDGTKRFMPSVFLGSRCYTVADGPFEVESVIAERLIKQGLAEAVTDVPPVPGAGAERAVAPKQGATRR
jgi:hypothetical protein